MEISSLNDDNLKEEATRQIIELGCSIEDVSKSTGICEMTLYRWTQESIRKLPTDK
jgi:transposase-like protein